MGIAILGSMDSWHTQQLTRAFEKRGLESIVFSPLRFFSSIGGEFCLSVKGVVLDQCEAVVVRSIPGGSLEQVIYRMDVLHRLERLGIPVINRPGCIEKTVDKFYTSALLQHGGIPTPRTLVTENFDEAMEAFHQFKNVVVKPIFGSLGRGMVQIDNEDVAYKVFKAWQLSRYVYYIQEFICHDNKDMRLFVVGGRVIAAICRCGTGWRTNLSRGGTAMPVQPDSLTEQLALKTAVLLGADYLGVDILMDEAGAPYVIEANSIPGWKGLQEATSLDIGQYLADHVYAAAKDGNR
jgi:RimK family alpha-L-glutamate ligase